MRKNIRSLFSVLLIICTVLVAWAVPFSAGLAQAKTVRVGWYLSKGFQEGTDINNISGSQYESLVRIAQFVDWKYEFVFGKVADLEQMLSNGEIDLLGGYAKTPEREGLYNYCTYPSYSSYMILLCRMDDKRFAYNDYAGFNGIKIAINHSEYWKSRVDQLAKDQNFTVNYVVRDTTADMYDALDKGEADAVVCSNLTQHKPYKLIHQWDPRSIYFVVNKQRPDLLNDLNSAMEILNVTEPKLSEWLERRYFGTQKSEFIIALTNEEQDYLKQAGAISVLLALDQRPLAYVENGQPQGFIPDYLALLSQKTGLKFKYIWCANYQEMQERFLAGEADICGQTYDYYGLTDSSGFKTIKPYVTLSNSLIYLQPRKLSIQKIAIEAGHKGLAERLHKSKYMYNLVLLATPEDCLQAVQEGKVDGAILPDDIFAQYSYHYIYNNLYAQRQHDLTTDLSLGISGKADPYLFRILAKTASTISPVIVSNLLLKNTTIKPQYTLLDKLVHNRLVLFVVLLLVISLLWLSWQKRYNKKLEEERSKADIANEAKSEFLSRMSHDIRTPLNGIIGMTYLTREMQLPAEARANLDKIDTSSKFLLSLINDVLDMTKAESGKIELHPEPYSLEEFTSYIEAVIKPLCKERNQTFSLDKSGAQSEIAPRIDKLRFNQILFNLLSNAIKYTPEGGNIKLIISSKTAANHKVALTTSVIDDGIGMSEAFQKVLFNPFTQEQRKESTERRGTGLGLAIVKRLVDTMGASITVQSQMGAGSNFTVNYLCDYGPVAEKQKAASVVQAVPTGEFDFTGKHVLLCEDHALNQEIVKALLTKRGVLLEIVGDGLAGTKEFAQSAPGYFDCILMDIQMPIMDGIKATEKIRAMDRVDAKTVPIIALTAVVFADDVEKFLAAGINDHIAKPIDPQVLFQKLAQFMQLKQR